MEMQINFAEILLYASKIAKIISECNRGNFSRIAIILLHKQF